MAYLVLSLQKCSSHNVLNKCLLKVVRETQSYYYVETVEFSSFDFKILPVKRISKKRLNNIDYTEFPDELFDKCKAIVSIFLSDYLEFTKNIEVYKGISVGLIDYCFFDDGLWMVWNYDSHFDCYSTMNINCTSDACSLRVWAFQTDQLKTYNCTVKKQDAMHAYNLYKDCLIELLMIMDDYLLQAIKFSQYTIEDEAMWF